MADKEDMPLSKLRGVASFDYDGSSALVRAGVEEVARSFNELRDAKSWQQNVVGQKVELTEQCFFVFRLNGHSWTNIIGRDRLVVDMLTREAGKVDHVTLLQRVQQAKSRELNKQDTLQLSQQLKTRAIYFGNSDTACALAYHIFENGELLEELETGEGFEIVTWKSSLHERAAIGEKLLPWVERVFRENDALALGISFMHLAGYVMHKPGDAITIGDTGNQFERVDSIAL